MLWIYRTPVKNGFEMIDALRKRNAAMPVTLIAGRANDKLRCLARRSEVSQVLEKTLSDGAPIQGIRGAFGIRG